MSRGKQGGIFLPAAQQLLVAEGHTPVGIDCADDRTDVLSGRKAVGGMGDAGNRDAVDGNHRRDAAADVHKAAKTLQMGDPGRDDIPGSQRADVLFQTQLLRCPAGKDRTEAAVALLPDALDEKADRLAHAGEQGDVPHRAVGNPQSAFAPRDDAAAKSEIDDQVVLLGTQNGACLQDGAGVECLPKSGWIAAETAVGSGIHQPTLRQEICHFFFPPSVRHLGADSLYLVFVK